MENVCNILFQLMKHGTNTLHVAFIYFFSIEAQSLNPDPCYRLGLCHESQLEANKHVTDRPTVEQLPAHRLSLVLKSILYGESPFKSVLVQN
jgi:hypothetical protein